MFFINNNKKNIFIFLGFLVFFIFYFFNHHKNIKFLEVKMYTNMIVSLQEDDIVSSKYYAKKIIKLNQKSIYYDIAILFLYSGEITCKKNDSYKLTNRFLKNKYFVFKKL